MWSEQDFHQIYFFLSDIVNNSAESVKRRKRKTTIVLNQKRGGR